MRLLRLAANIGTYLNYAIDEIHSSRDCMWSFRLFENKIRDAYCAYARAPFCLPSLASSCGTYAFIDKRVTRTPPRNLRRVTLIIRPLSNIRLIPISLTSAQTLIALHRPIVHNLI